GGSDGTRKTSSPPEWGFSWASATPSPATASASAPARIPINMSWNLRYGPMFSSVLQWRVSGPLSRRGTVLLDHLIRPLQERRRDRQAEGLGGLEVEQMSSERRCLSRHLVQPELHVHLAIHRCCGSQVLLRLLPPARALVELPETEVAVGEEGTETQFGG